VVIKHILASVYFYLLKIWKVGYTCLLGVDTARTSSNLDPTTITFAPFTTPNSLNVRSSFANPFIITFCIDWGTPAKQEIKNKT
jgi:P pilus assembly chaperone PapD